MSRNSHSFPEHQRLKWLLNLFIYNALSCLFCFCFFLFTYFFIIIIIFFLKFKYSRTEDSIKKFCDDVIVNLGSPPAERYTVTNLEPDTFYNFSFDGMSSCRQRLSQMIKAKTFASGKLGLISYLYVFLLQRKNNFHPL